MSDCISFKFTSGDYTAEVSTTHAFMHIDDVVEQFNNFLRVAGFVHSVSVNEVSNEQEDYDFYREPYQPSEESYEDELNEWPHEQEERKQVKEWFAKSEAFKVAAANKELRRLNIVEDDGDIEENFDLKECFEIQDRLSREGY